MNRLILLCLALASVATASNYKRVCYYTNWAQYRPAGGKYFPEDVDANLCTHVIYSFAKIGRGGKLAMYEWNDDKMYPRMMALKKKNPELKVLLAVGGWNHENGKPGKFSTMVATPERRSVFIKSTIALLREWGFDGFDLDWEYPANRGNSPPGDKQKFTILTQELLAAFERDAAERQMPRLLLTAAVAAGYKTIATAYDIPGIAKTLDWINLMAYDLHGQWDKKTGHHTAMVGDDKLTVPYSVEFWMKGGMPAGKIALGLATYGRAFRLKSKDSTGLNAQIHDWSSANKGKFTREGGFLAYYEICKMGLTLVKDNAAGAPYGYAGDQWVGYDTIESIKEKVNTLIKGKGLAGAMFWALDLDDFTGRFCGEGKYPLMRAVAKELGGYTPPPEPTVGPKPPTEKPVPTNKPDPNTQGPRPTSGGGGACRAVGSWKGNSNMDAWCVANCARGNCPGNICKCD